MSGWRLAEHLAAELQRLLVERLGLAVAALALRRAGQVVEAGERVGVRLAQHLAAELQRLLVERLGLAVAALACVETARLLRLPSVSGWRSPSTSRRSCSACW